MQGEATLTFSSLKPLEKLFPQLLIDSSGELFFDFTHAQKQQNLQIDGTLKEYYFNYFLGSSLFVDANLKDLFNSPKGDITLKGEELAFHDLQFKTFDAAFYSKLSGIFTRVL